MIGTFGSPPSRKYACSECGGRVATSSTVRQAATSAWPITWPPNTRCHPTYGLRPRNRFTSSGSRSRMDTSSWTADIDRLRCSRSLPRCEECRDGGDQEKRPRRMTRPGREHGDEEVDQARQRGHDRDGAQGVGGMQGQDDENGGEGPPRNAGQMPGEAIDRARVADIMAQQRQVWQREQPAEHVFLAEIGM